MCAFSATDDELPLMFILAGIRNIPFASADNANYYSCSPSGWMSEHLFNLWYIIFVSHIQCKCAKMNERERNIPFILFLKVHSSRMSPFALSFFNKFNIIVIIFPAHSTHVLQPFDVSIASSLKSWYIKSLTCNLQFYRLYGQPHNTQARYTRIRAFIDAWCMITPADCQRAFNSSGIYPFDEPAVKMQHLIHPAGQNMYEGRTSVLSSNIVFSNESVANVSLYYRRIKWPDGSVNDIEPEINCTEAKIVWET